MKKKVDVCIVGGGPGGAMLGLLLAQSGCKVVVYEKASNYQREFRGESISPDSVSILDELGLMPAIEKHGYIQTKRMEVCENNRVLLNVDFSRFKFPYQYSIDIPQPVLIGAILDKAKQYKNFSHVAGAKCLSLIKSHGKVRGANIKSQEGEYEVLAKLVVAADGRYGKCRHMAGLGERIRPLKRDVIWFRLPIPENWGEKARLSMKKNKHLIILPTYPDQLRVGFNVPKGGYKVLREKGLTYFYQQVVALEPEFDGLVQQYVTSWADTSLLDIFTLEAPQWSIDGFMLLGDAAHTLTPILGQGVNHAIKDAVALAPIIANAIGFYPDYLPASLFVNYENHRKKDVGFVHAFQYRQEKVLDKSSVLGTFVRRQFYRFMHISHWLQRRLWQKIIYERQMAQRAQKVMAQLKDNYGLLR